MRLAYVAAFAVFFPFSVHAAEVSCGLGQPYGMPAVSFGEVSGEFDLNNFNDTGRLGIKIVISGNDNRTTYASSVEYKKVGERIELVGDPMSPHMAMPGLSFEEIKSHFGPFPEVSCTIP